MCQERVHGCNKCRKGLKPAKGGKFRCTNADCTEKGKLQKGAMFLQKRKPLNDETNAEYLARIMAGYEKRQQERKELKALELQTKRELWEATKPMSAFGVHYLTFLRVGENPFISKGKTELPGSAKVSQLTLSEVNAKCSELQAQGLMPEGQFVIVWRAWGGFPQWEPAL